MNIFKEKENLKMDFPTYLSGKESKQREEPDVYPQPDSIHSPIQLHISGDNGEDKTVLRLQSLSKAENESGETLNAVTDGGLSAHAPRTSVVSSELNSATPALGIKATDGAQNNGNTDTAAEIADVVEDTMKKSFPRQRPGVILLGRGNSFSLGRSEVIFLHNTKPYRRAKGQKIQQQGSVGIANQRDGQIDRALHNLTTESPNPGKSEISSSQASAPGIRRPSPPPFSNQVSHHSGGVSVDTGNWPITLSSGKTTEELVSGACYSISSSNHEASVEGQASDSADTDELAALWVKAERIMAGKKQAVLDVLAQFGVGESGEGTQQEEEEEESVWQVVESKAHAVDR